MRFKDTSVNRRNEREKKGFLSEPTIKEKKRALEKEMERQRQIQSILRQRQSDPPILENGDPIKPYYYETIEASVFSGVMHEFEKVPKKSYDIENTDFN